MKSMMPEVTNRKLEGIPIPPEDFKKFGIENTKVYAHVKDLDELRKQGPNMIVAECKRQCEFMQNRFKTQVLKKKNKYVMSLSVYRQLHYSENYGGKVLRPCNTKFENLYKPYNGEPLDGKRLLIWRTGGIGDLIFIQPNLIYLKEKYPTCEIYFACGPQYHAMVETWSCIDKLVDLPFNYLQMLRADYHVTFEGVIERCDLAKHTNAYRLFTDWMGLNLPDEKLVPKQEPKKEWFEKARAALWSWGIEGKPFILAQLRASSPIRTPRPQIWGKALDLLASEGYNIVITDSKRFDSGINNFINTFISKENRGRVFNYAPFSETLDSTIALAAHSSLVLSIDSALVHIAASLGRKSLTIYGPFPSHIRISTYGENAQAIECNKVACAPCYIHGHLPCKYAIDDHGICFDLFPFDELKEKVYNMMPK